MSGSVSAERDNGRVDAVFEREAAVAAIHELLDEARAGSGGTLFLVGEAGLGKTTMLELARSLAGDAFDVIHGQGDPMESALPFGIVSQSLRELPTGWAPVPLQPPVPGAEARAALFYEALRLLQESTQKPTLLMFDDLQWTDPDSLRLAMFLVRRIPALKVAALATLRLWPAAALQAARQAVNSGRARIQTLSPLSEEAAMQLLQQRVGRPLQPDEERQLWSLTSGNPLLIEQAALRLTRRQAVPNVDEQHPDRAERELVLSRFLGISELERRYAQTASVFGTRFEPALAAEVAGLEEEDAGQALEALCRGGLVRGAAPAAAEFVHPLFRQALYEDLAEPLRAHRHAHVFKVMMAHGLDPAEAVEHAKLGHLVGDQQAIDALERVGQAAATAGAFSVAREHLLTAAQLAGDQAGDHLLLSLAEAMLASGQTAEAIPLCRRVLDRANAPDAARAAAHRRLAVALYVAGQTRESDQELQGALSTAAGDSREAVQALLDVAAVHWITRGPRHGLELAAQARTRAQDAAADLEARAEATRGFCAYQCGDPAGLSAVELAARRAELDPVADLSNLDWSWGTLSMHVAIANFSERFEDAERVFGIARDAAERVGAPMASVALTITQAGALVRQGRLNESLELADHADILIGLTPALAPWAAWVRALILFEMGRGDESEAACNRLAELLGDDEQWLPMLRLWLHRLRAGLLEWRGQIAHACLLFERAEALAEATGILEPCVVPWMAEAAAAYLAADRVDDAMRLAGRLDKRSAGFPCRWPKAMAAMVKGRIAESQGRPEEAQRHFESAVKTLDGLRMPLAEARVLLAYGAFLRRHSEPRRARPVLGKALQLTEAAGAGWLAHKAQEELAAAGGRRLRKEHPDELTAQESRVADLTSQGLSNEQIARAMVVSVKTVETHLHHVYDKLDIRSRRELILRSAQLEHATPSTAQTRLQ